MHITGACCCVCISRRQLLAGWPWKSYLFSLCPSFLFGKIEHEWYLSFRVVMKIKWEYTHTHTHIYTVNIWHMFSVNSNLFKKKYLSIYLAVSGLSCGMPLGSVIVAHGLSSCGCMGFLSSGICDLSSPTRDWIQSPALQDRFLTPGSPGKSQTLMLTFSLLITFSR